MITPSIYSLQNHCISSFRTFSGFAVSHAFFSSLRQLFHFSDVLIGLWIDCANMHFIVRDHCFLTGELLVAWNGLEVDFLVRKDRVPRIDLDILVEFTLLHFTDQFAMLDGHLVDEICPSWPGEIVSASSCRRWNGRICHVRFLHILTRFLFSYVIVSHDHLVDFNSDLLEAFVHLLIELVELLGL